MQEYGAGEHDEVFGCGEGWHVVLLAVDLPFARVVFAGLEAEVGGDGLSGEAVGVRPVRGRG